MNQEMKIALRLARVTMSFDQLRVIADATLDVHAGERHAVIGPNGAGKSTLFNLISGRMKPTSGTIYLGRKEISGRSPKEINRAGLARSFQITNIFPKLTVFENVQIAMMAKAGARFAIFQQASGMARVNEEAQTMLASVGLADRRDVLAESLTYSQQRALELALTLATDPDVILLDEPTAGMSREETEHAVALIDRTTKGKTLLVVEHDMSVVFGLSDRISVLANGTFIATGTPREIQANVDVQRAYLGEVMN